MTWWEVVPPVILYLVLAIIFTRNALRSWRNALRERRSRLVSVVRASLPDEEKDAVLVEPDAERDRGASGNLT